MFVDIPALAWCRALDGVFGSSPFATHECNSCESDAELGISSSSS